MPHSDTLIPSVAQLTGPLPYTLTNDYLFRAILQEDENILRSLLCALLRLCPDQIKTVEIKNPIKLGTAIDNKTFVLDILLMLNDSSIITIEMQIVNYGNWPERALGYLCRSFDSLNRGEDYTCTKPAVQISILDFSLFKDVPEFYSTYHLTNDRNHHLYTDKFCLHVLDLTHINLATDSDIEYHLDTWCEIFKAKTWEDIRMAAKRISIENELSSHLAKLTEDEEIRQQCEARELFEAHERGIKKIISKLETDNAKLTALTQERDAKIKQLDTQNQNLDCQIQSLRQKLIDAGINPDS